MLIKVSDPAFQTLLFSLIFVALLVISISKRKDDNFFSKDVTNQIKGVAILAVIFSHIAYFASSDTKFLYPYSILAGVAVNIFLFLSGFGLTLSQLKSPLSPFSFYKKRVLRLFIPLWVVIGSLLLLDYIILGRSYPFSEVINAFLGFYPRADVYQNLDSPLWYFSFILFYYLVFPLTFIKRLPLLSPILILVASLLALKFIHLQINPDVIKLYKLHTLAFPLGMFLGLLIQRFKFKLNLALNSLVLIAALAIFTYTAIHSGIGEDPKIEQTFSLITTLSLIIIFALSKFNFRLLSLFGIYSYEIYLFHWPILSRYNLFLGLPPFLDVIFNLSLFILLGYLLQKMVGKITGVLHR